MIKNPGEMLARIRVQKPVAVGDGINKHTEWADIGNESENDPPNWIWAKWENVHGSEAWIAESVQANSAATVSVWYSSEITRKCRVIDDAGIVFEIASIDDIRREHREMELKVKAEVNG